MKTTTLIPALFLIACGGTDPAAAPPVPLLGDWYCAIAGAATDPPAFNVGDAAQLRVDFVTGEGAASGTFSARWETLTQQGDVDGAWSDGSLRVWEVDRYNGRAALGEARAAGYGVGDGSFTLVLSDPPEATEPVMGLRAAPVVCAKR